MSDLCIETHELGRMFGKTAVLRDISWQASAGNVVALLGPNGSGKTTLFKLVRGLLIPTSGSSTLLGTRSDSLPDSVTNRVCCVLEGCSPPKWVTIRQLMDLHAAAYPQFDRALAEELVKQRGLPLNRRFWTFSKGQQRWAELALSIASRPDVLLLDEPADGLDPAVRRELYDRLRELANERNTAVVVASHVIADVERIADELVLIQHGQITLQASLETLREEVREIELPADQVPLQWGDGMRVLGSKRATSSRVTWVRTPGGDVDRRLQGCLSERAVVRPVGLEMLYFACTEYAEAS